MTRTRKLAAAALAASVLAGALASAPAQAAPQTPAQQLSPTAQASPRSQASLGTTQSAPPSVGAGFAATAQWLARGTVSLEWDDVTGATGYEVMWRSETGWALLSEHDPAGGVVAAELDGPSALVGSLPQHLGEYWFAVRAQNAWGMSQWSPSFSATVPVSAVIPEDIVPVFDPFTAPTRSNIDLERLGQAAATITPSQADCTAVPALDVAGITIVDAPAGLADPDAPLTVAEVVRIAGGCLLIEYADLGARTVADIRELLASEATVFAVSEPARGFAPDHDSAAHGVPGAHTGDHHEDDGEEQWHLPQPAMRDLWDAWKPANPVTVAVLDTGVDVDHLDLVNQLASSRAGGCHGEDPHSHGTHVAGIVAAQAGNGLYVAGVAPDAKILPVSVAMKGNTCTNAKADLAPLSPPAAVAEAVNRGARVINMSFSGPSRRDMAGLEAGGVDIDDADTYEAVLRTASMLGVVNVASAGNCGAVNAADRDSCVARNLSRAPAIFSKVPVGVDPGNPSFVDGDVISVARIQRSGTRWHTSNANMFVDIAAPGGGFGPDGILSTVPLLKCETKDDDSDGTVDRWTPLGCGLVDTPTECATSTALRERADDMPEDCAHRIAHKGGTSMAAPFVSGVVAHMLNRYPQATPGQVRAALVESARDAGSAGRDDEYGHGIVDPAEAVEKLGEVIARESVGEPAGGFVSVAAGGLFSCGVFANGAVRCWGDEELADAVPRTQEFSQVSAPVGLLGYGCGLRPLGPGDGRGTVLCWSGVSGRVLEFAPQGAFTQLAAGRERTCGLRPSGEAVCWENMTGARSADVPSGEFEELSGGWEHWCGLRADDTVVCWGDNSHGQQDIPAGSLFDDIAAGGKHTCGVSFLSGVQCWGDAAAISGAPATLGFQSLDAGFEHTCGVQNESQTRLSDTGHTVAVCWGDNSHGQTDAPPGRFAEVSAGWRHNCGTVREGGIASGRVVCWGDDSFGQAPSGQLASLSLTDGDGGELVGFDPDVVDYEVMADPGSAMLSWTVGDAANSGPTVAALPEDADEGTPDSHEVELADGAVVEVAVTPLFGFGVPMVYRIDVMSLPRLASLSVRPAGSGPLCVPACPLLSLSPAFEPGTTAYGVVVDPDVAQITVGFHGRNLADPVSAAPPDADTAAVGHQVELSTNAGFAQMEAGNWHTCGVLAGGATRCWGSNVSGRSSVPAGSFSSVSGGWGHTCAIDANGAAVCWGDNYFGQSRASSGSFSAVSAGWGHSCGLTTSGSARCWGYNFSGQSRPPSGTFSAVAAGGNHSCGITSTGSLRCWGLNLNGQASPPAGVFTALAVGWRHNCAIKTDATVACWGNSGSGRTAAPSGSFTAVSSGQEHSCGVNTDGAVVCWGDNSSGQSTAPTGSFASVSAGEDHTCGLTTTGTVQCWGTGTATQPAAPATVTVTVTSAAEPDNSTSYTIAISRTAAQTASSAPRARSESEGRAAIDGKIDKATRTPSTQCPDTADDKQVALPDPVLRASIEQELGKTPGASITASEMGTLTELSLARDTDSEAVAALTGIEHATALEALDLGGNNISNLTPLACLTNLEVLNAAQNQITDASPLAGLAGLERLYLHGNQIADISSLSAMTGLAGLDVSFNQIADVGALRSLTSLVSLGVGGNQIADLSPLGALSGLEALYLFDNAVADAGALSDLSGLDVLWADGNRITATTALAALSTLGYLDVRYNEIADPSPLEATARTTHTRPQNDTPADIPDVSLRAAVQAALGLNSAQAPTIGQLATLTELERVGPPDDPAPIRSLEGLQHAINLDTLALRSNQISDITPIAGLAGLGRLDLQDNRFSALEQLGGLGSLRWLNLIQNGIASTDRLPPLGGLEMLFLDLNQITNIEPLQHLTSLTRLGLVGNQIADIEPLRNLAQLDWLMLSANPIADLSPIAVLRKLHYLRLTNTRTTDLTPVSALAQITELHLSQNQIADLAPLTALTKLRLLDIRTNQITDLAPLAALAQLRDLYVDPAADLAPLAALTELTIHQ